MSENSHTVGAEAQRVSSDIMSCFGLSEQLICTMTGLKQFPLVANVSFGDPQAFDVQWFNRNTNQGYDQVFRLHVSWSVPEHRSIVLEHAVIMPADLGREPARFLKWVYEEQTDGYGQHSYVLTRLQIAPLAGEKTFSRGSCDRFATAEADGKLFAPMGDAILFRVSEGVLQPDTLIRKGGRSVSDEQLIGLSEMLPYRLIHNPDGTGTVTLAGQQDGMWCKKGFTVPGVPLHINADFGELAKQIQLLRKK